jgi:hypothetical protein
MAMMLAGLTTSISLLHGADGPGLKSRANSESYPGHSKADVIAIGAEMLSQEEVRNTFATDLNRGFLVVEVGVFPAAGKTWNVNPNDFSLRIGADKMIRPAAPATIAAILQRKAHGKQQTSRGGTGPGDIVVYPTATIGYESTSPGVLDPNGRPRRGGGGWVTGGGVGVGMGGNGGGSMPMPPASGSTDVDRSTMSMELSDKALPEGEIKQAIAGYLYFPMPDAKKSGVAGKAFELTYQNVDTKVRVPLPAPK